MSMHDQISEQKQKCLLSLVRNGTPPESVHLLNVGFSRRVVQ
jgi:hypothetical protein